MLRDYLRSYWRGVLHNKVATLINVGGLALGLAVFLALSFHVDREFSWDEQWEDAERIYIAAGAQESVTGTTSSILTSAPYVLGDALMAQHPDAFETYARVHVNFTNTTAVVDDKEFPSLPVYYAERSLLELLQFDVLEGSLDEVFADPRSIAIHQGQVERLFGDSSPLGKILTFKSDANFGAQQGPPRDFIVKAVYTLPLPTVFAMPMLAVLETGALPQPNTRLDLWQVVPRPPVAPPQPGQAPPPPPEQPFPVTHYFKLRAGVDVKALEGDLRAFMDENRYMDFGMVKTRFIFRKLTDQHLAPSPIEVTDSVQRLWVYAAIGTLVLLISGCNFVMLATLRLIDRMREVGIRKSVGGGAGQLMWQYLFDAFISTFVAALLAVLFLGFAFPKLQTMLEIPMQIDILTPRNLGLSLLAIVIFTFISSLYPAWMSSRTRPGPLLRNGGGAVVGTGTGLRKLLVGIQFAIVVVLLLATAVVRQQIAYTKNRDPGYSTEQVVSLRLNTASGNMNGLAQRTPALLDEFRKLPGVEAAAIAGPLGSISIANPTLVKTTASDGTRREAGLMQSFAGAGYFKVMSVRLLAGREFSAELDGIPPGTPPGTVPPGPRNVMLNASAVRLLGFASPDAAIEQLLEIETTNAERQSRTQSLRVVGVIADTQFSSAMLPPNPEYYNFTPQNISLVVKAAAGADKAAVTEAVKATADTILDGEGSLVTADLSTLGQFMLRREEFEARIITGSTLLAIVIALLGLYGLVAATVVKRVKEIGVRKVMGAERSSLITLFLWQFSKPIAAANIIAWPVGFWAMTQWLQRFPYQLDTVVIVLTGIGASLAALLIAWLTVGLMAARAAGVNPVWALRYE